MVNAVRCFCFSAVLLGGLAAAKQADAHWCYDRHEVRMVFQNPYTGELRYGYADVYVWYWNNRKTGTNWNNAVGAKNRWVANGWIYRGYTSRKIGHFRF